MVNFMDAASCGESALHDYNTTAGIVLDESEISEYAWVRQGDVYYEAAFPHYFAKYCLFSPDELYKFNRDNGVSDETGLNGKGYFGNIDPSPFEDPETGEKYLYVKMEGTNGIMAIHMFDWLTPDWENAEIVLMVNYYTVEDWRKIPILVSLTKRKTATKVRTCSIMTAFITLRSPQTATGRATTAWRLRWGTARWGLSAN